MVPPLGTLAQPLGRGRLLLAGAWQQLAPMGCSQSAEVTSSSSTADGSM
jgi:hypothetical protein